MVPEGLIEQLLSFFQLCLIQIIFLNLYIIEQEKKNSPQLNTLGTKLNVSCKARLAYYKKKGNDTPKNLLNACVDGRFHPTFLYYIYKSLFFFPIKGHTFTERKGYLFVKSPESRRFLENYRDGKASDIHMD